GLSSELRARNSFFPACSILPPVLGSAPNRLTSEERTGSLPVLKREWGSPALFVFKRSHSFMTSELLSLFEYYEKEKGIDRATMIEAVEAALLSASKKSAVGRARELRIQIDEKKGNIKAIAKLIVVETVTQPYDEIAIDLAKRIKPDVALGEELDVEVT